MVRLQIRADRVNIKPGHIKRRNHIEVLLEQQLITLTGTIMPKAYPERNRHSRRMSLLL